MRLAPAVLFALDDPAACCTLAAEQSRTTHGAPQAVQACAFFADLLRRAISGEGKQSLLTGQDWDGHPTVKVVAAGGWRGKARTAIRSSGYVIHTLEAALWSVAETDSFEAALVLAVNLADDADTVGAVTGQLAGAIYGMHAIPARWLEKLAWRERLVNAADALTKEQGSDKPDKQRL